MVAAFCRMHTLKIEDSDEFPLYQVGNLNANIKSPNVYGLMGAAQDLTTLPHDTNTSFRNNN
jgi:hypothetical protein